jgi:hypothetical protein
MHLENCALGCALRARQFHSEPISLIVMPILMFCLLSLLTVAASAAPLSELATPRSQIAAPRSQLAVGEALSWPTPCPPNIQCVAGYDTVTSPDGSTTLTISGSANGVAGGTLQLHGPNVSWSSGVSGAVAAVMQSDGNFVAFNAAGQQIWSSYTSGHAGATLKVDTSEVTIVTPDKQVIWRATYTAQQQCQAATQAVQAENLKVTLDADDQKAFAGALSQRNVAQCENQLLAKATASLASSACSIAQTMPLDPANSPKAAAAQALKQADGDAAGQFYTQCYSPYIAQLDKQACTSFCTNMSNLKACKFTSPSQCEADCFGARPVGSNCPVLVKTPMQPSPYGPVK